MHELEITRLRQRIEKVEARIAHLTAQADHASANAPGSFVTGRSGRSRAMNRRTERALELTIRNAVKCSALRDVQRRLENKILFYQRGGWEGYYERRTADKARHVAQERARRQALRAQPLEKRLFIGQYPEGWVYADRLTEKDLAFQSYRTLALDIYKTCPRQWLPLIQKKALEHAALEGTLYQNIVLGSAYMTETEMDYAYLVGKHGKEVAEDWLRKQGDFNV